MRPYSRTELATRRENARYLTDESKENYVAALAAEAQCRASVKAEIEEAMLKASSNVDSVKRESGQYDDAWSMSTDPTPGGGRAA